MPTSRRTRARSARPDDAGDFAAFRDDIKDAFFNFLDASDDVFWIAEVPPWRQVYVNKAVERVWGIPRERFYSGSQHWSDLVHPDDRPLVLDTHDRWINGEPGSEFDMTFRIILPNSQMRWVHDRGIWVSPKISGLALIAGIATDITESRLLEQALQDSERRLRRLFEDRERMSQNLHDDILQSLYALGLELEMTKRLARQSPPQAPAKLQDATARLNRVIAEIRGFLHGMNAGLLPGTGFTKALEDLAASLGSSGPGRVNIQIDEAACARLGTEQQIDMLGIIREAASNSLRHAGAERTLISAWTETGTLVVAVEDDGSGFDTATPDGHGLGLRNMKARARRIGASIEIRSGASGTKVILRLPLA